MLDRDHAVCNVFAAQYQIYPILGEDDSTTRVLPGKKENMGKRKGCPLQIAGHLETIVAGVLSRPNREKTTTNTASPIFFGLKNALHPLPKFVQIQFEDLFLLQLQGLLQLLFRGLIQL